MLQMHKTEREMRLSAVKSGSVLPQSMCANDNGEAGGCLVDGVKKKGEG